jgi:ABC-type multidrug transport system ATPase subunit
VGVIRSGKLVGEGTVDELRGRAGLRVRAEPLASAERVVAALDSVEKVTTSDGALRITADVANAPAINRSLVHAGIDVTELSPERASLEQVFLELTGNRKDES